MHKKLCFNEFLAHNLLSCFLKGSLTNGGIATKINQQEATRAVIVSRVLAWRTVRRIMIFEEIKQNNINFVKKKLIFLLLKDLCTDTFMTT
jgi:hypothetical protein